VFATIYAALKAPTRWCKKKEKRAPAKTVILRRKSPHYDEVRCIIVWQIHATTWLSNSLMRQLYHPTNLGKKRSEGDDTKKVTANVW